MKIFVGYDPTEDMAYQVCEYSIHKHTPSASVIPLILKNVLPQGLPKDHHASTEFTLSRYLIPFICNYKGWALFIDSDTLALADMQEIFNVADSSYAVMCVQHKPYEVKSPYKKNGKAQFNYPRKNWSSVMLWNCAHPSNRKLTPSYISNQTPQYLHRLQWLEDGEIGNLSVEWNWLVGYYTGSHGTPKLLHYTDGGPWYKPYRQCEYSDVWKEYLMEMLL